MRGSLLLGCAATALGLLSHADRALANGRFPNAQQLIVAPDNPDRLWLRATHGVLTSADRGKTWRWICEEAIGYSGTRTPRSRVTGHRRGARRAFRDLSVSRDDGCEWQPRSHVRHRRSSPISASTGTTRAE